MDRFDHNQIEPYEGSRDLMKIWAEDLTDNEIYLAEKAFTTGTPDEARRWGNHLLKVLRAKKSG